MNRLMNRDRDAARSKMFTRRLALLAAGKMALFGVLVGRMYYLQVVEADKYRTMADDNRINLRLLARRAGASSIVTAK